MPLSLLNSPPPTPPHGNSSSAKSLLPFSLTIWHGPFQNYHQNVKQTFVSWGLCGYRKRWPGIAREFLNIFVKNYERSERTFEKQSSNLIGDLINPKSFALQTESWSLIRVTWWMPSGILARSVWCVHGPWNEHRGFNTCYRIPCIIYMMKGIIQPEMLLISAITMGR